MTTILAYCDPISAAPGDAVRFMVSCEGAAAYQAEIVRLVNPQAEPEVMPFQVEPVTPPASRSYRPRIQKLQPNSLGNLCGERAWRSRRRHGTNAPPAYRPNQRQPEVAE
jgi:N,N-dimethylformamidase